MDLYGRVVTHREQLICRERERKSHILDFVQHISTTEKKLSSSTSLLVTVLKESFCPKLQCALTKKLEVK